MMNRHEITKKQLVGFGSDGAPVMTGRLNGVAKQLQDKFPAIISVHCIAHRLALVRHIHIYIIELTLPFILQNPVIICGRIVLTYI